MTTNRKIKQTARKTAAKQGISYMEALKSIQKLSCEEKPTMLSASTEYVEALLTSESGNHLVGGLTGVGKTTFLAHVAANLLKAGKTVSWYNPVQDENPKTLLQDEIFDSENFYYQFGNIEDYNRILNSDYIIYDELRSIETILNLFLEGKSTVIASIHASDTKKTLTRFNHIGYKNQIDSTVCIQRTDKDNFALNYLSTFDDSKAQVISITSPKGGTGKTTIALSFSSQLAKTSVIDEYGHKRNLRVALVDLDVRDGQVGMLIGQFSPTMLNLSSKGLSNEAFLETMIHDEKLDIDVLLAPRRSRSADELSLTLLSEIIEKLKQQYDFVILDTPVFYPNNEILEEVVYPQSDRIIIATETSNGALKSLYRQIELFTTEKDSGGYGVSSGKIGIVINKSIVNSGVSGEKVASYTANIPIISVIPNLAREIFQATNLQDLSSLADNEKYSNPLKRMAKSVMSKNHKLV